jgi:A/G-specific adenine glycosylase
LAKTKLAAKLLKWYAGYARELPWRGLTDPYAIWISEVMLQQTRVDSVVPYFRRWMRRFPTVRILARASERDVLTLWEGLGYYSRARNLRKAARLIVRDFGGRLPSDATALRALPGIGSYTAAAIASIAFGRDEPALDGNIRRVLARLFNVRHRLDSPRGRRRLTELAATHMPTGHAGDYNQALMDLGATVCLPRQPRCAACPAARLCEARRLGIQEHLPVVRPRKLIPHRWLAALVVKRRGRVLLAKRPSLGLLGGLWEFPNVGMRGNSRLGSRLSASLASGLEETYGLLASPIESLATVEHAYTHFRVTAQVYVADFQSLSRRSTVRWVSLTQLAHFPMGKVDRQIARQLLT